MRRSQSRYKRFLRTYERDMLKRLPPLQRAYWLEQRRIPVAAWSDEELQAFIDHECPHYKELTDAQLDAVAAAPEGGFFAWYERTIGENWHAARDRCKARLVARCEL